MYVCIESYWCCYCYSNFDSNFGAGAAAINIAYYNARFNNVTFRNNTGTTVRVSSCMFLSLLLLLFAYNKNA